MVGRPAKIQRQKQHQRPNREPVCRNALEPGQPDPEQSRQKAHRDQQVAIGRGLPETIARIHQQFRRQERQNAQRRVVIDVLDFAVEHAQNRARDMQSVRLEGVHQQVSVI